MGAGTGADFSLRPPRVPPARPGPSPCTQRPPQRPRSRTAWMWHPSGSSGYGAASTLLGGRCGGPSFAIVEGRSGAGITATDLVLDYLNGTEGRAGDPPRPPRE